MNLLRNLDHDAHDKGGLAFLGVVGVVLLFVAAVMAFLLAFI